MKNIMNSNYPPLPLSCENHVRPSIPVSSSALGHVVESTTPLDTRLHPHERLKFAEHEFNEHELNASNHYNEPRLGAHDDEDINDRGFHASPAKLTSNHNNEGALRRDARRNLRRADKFDREATRARAQQERRERRARRNSQRGPTSRGRPTRRARLVDDHHELTHTRGPGLRWLHVRGGNQIYTHTPPGLSTDDHVNGSRGAALVATHSNSVKRFAAGPLHGIGLALYFMLLPYVVVTKWGIAGEQTHGTLVRGLLVCLALFWLAFLGQLGRNVSRLRSGTGISTSGSAWLAGLIVALLSFLVPGFLHSQDPISHREGPLTSRTSDAPSPFRMRQTPTSRSTRANESDQSGPARSPLSPREPISVLSALPMALAAKRRHDALRQHQFECPDDEIDELIDALRSLDPTLVARLRFLIGPERSGVIHISGALENGELSHDNDPLVGCLLATGDEAIFAFSREGGTLSVDPLWSEVEITESIVALHDGRLTFARSESELLRALATRALHNVTVVYLGFAPGIDDELRSSCVTLSTATPDESAPDTSLASREAITTRTEVRVELLRASPTVIGLREPFAPTLRRRCVEMVAYLALHHDEPVTGERLRSRVLGYADVEASSRTLANTASAVRRSLGTDAAGTLLHPVSSSGLYETHSVTSDVALFHALIVRARSLAVPEASLLAHQALQLVQGEPLSSALRGFEWFLAEGHLGQLQRDGEYAALLLHHQATSQGDYELAFWSLQQGLRIDPFSDVLIETIARVPRLRQFGSDRPSRAQDESVGAGGTVVVGWSFNRLGNQIVE